MPGAGGIDHGVGLHDFRALTVLISDFEGCGLAALGLQLVEKMDVAVGIHDLPMRVRRIRNNKVI